MKCLAWVLSWTLFYIGHFVSKISNNRFLAWLYPLYNWLMCRSCDISDKYQLDVWLPPIKNTESDDEGGAA